MKKWLLILTLAFGSALNAETSKCDSAESKKAYAQEFNTLSQKFVFGADCFSHWLSAQEAFNNAFGVPENSKCSYEAVKGKFIEKKVKACVALERERELENRKIQDLYGGCGPADENNTQYSNCH